MNLYKSIFVLICMGASLVSTTVHGAGPAVVDLLSADDFTIVSKTGITNTGSHASSITGDIGSSPITASAMDNVFCSEITGTIYGVDALYVGSGTQTCFAGNPPLSNKTKIDNAVLDMGTAYTDAAGRINPTATELGAGDIGGMTITPGLYKWSTGVTIPTSVTLSGSANDVWIFQIAGDLSIASGGSVPAGVKVLLSGGASAANIFWQVGGATGATLGTYSTFNGNILSEKQIIMQTGAVLNGRALAQTQVTLDANTISTPATPPPAATLHVIKLVVNGSSGTAVASDFSVTVKIGGVNVSGSPTAGASAPGTSYSLTAGTYVISETANTSYTQSFSGDCDSNGSITLASSDDKTCTIINTDIPIPASSSGGSSGGSYIIPLIGLTKIPSPLSLPKGTHPVTYHYTVWNAGIFQSLADISLSDDSCSPVLYASGDLNSNKKIDVGEKWKYTCNTTLSKTTTGTAVATGYSDDTRHVSAIATAIATVVVGTPVTAPLINILKVPSRLTPFNYGGGYVVYTYTVTNPGVVPISAVSVADDKCTPVTRISGDININKLLDVSESWVYTCRTHIATTTRNVATAKGVANGFSAIDYAFATVVVSAPGLPKTGFPSRDNTNVIGIVFLGVAISIALYGIKKRKSV